MILLGSIDHILLVIKSLHLDLRACSRMEDPTVLALTPLATMSLFSSRSRSVVFLLDFPHYVCGLYFKVRIFPLHSWDKKASLLPTALARRISEKCIMSDQKTERSRPGPAPPARVASLKTSYKL